jgi:hypothetical protein
MSNKQVTTENKPVKTAVGKDGKPLRVGTGLPGPGRPKKADEQQARQLGMAALKKQYGTLEKAFQALLTSKEPSLIRLVFEYSFGKPADKIESVNGIPFNQLNIQIIATKKQSNESTDDSNISIPTGQ